MTAPRTGSRQPPRIVREPGTSVPRQIEDWLAGHRQEKQPAPGEAPDRRAAA